MKSRFTLVGVFIIINLLPLSITGQEENWVSIGPTEVGYNSRIIYDSVTARFFLYGNNTIFRSDDNCLSWKNISTEFLNDNGIIDLVINENNHNELYSLNTRRIIYKSTDAGETWQYYYSDSVHNIIFLDKQNPDNLIALKPIGGWGDFLQTVEKSSDAGKHWFEITNGIDISVGPLSAWVNSDNPDIIFSLQSVTYGGDIFMGTKLYKTLDGGLSWHPVNIDSVNYISSLLYDPTDTKKIFLKSYEKLWLKTTDRGETWFEIGTGLPHLANDLYISPYNSNLLYSTISSELPDEYTEIYKSEDGGLNWSVFTSTNSQSISSVLIDPLNHNEIYISSYPHGFFKSSNNGQIWEEQSNGLTNSTVYSIAVGNEKILYAGVENRGFLKTSDGGKSWKLIDKNLSTDPGKIIVSPVDPLKVYVNSYINGHRFSVSDNGGEDWQSYDCPYNGLYTFKVADDEKTIYGDVFTGDIDGLTVSSIIKSTDGGESWKLLNLGIEHINYIDEIKIDPKDRNIVYVIAAIRGTININSLIRSKNGGIEWKTVCDTAFNIFLNEYDDNYIYHTYGNSLFISNNKGNNFIKVNIDNSIVDMVTDRNNGILYGLTFNGAIIKSEDKGYSWTAVEDLQRNAGIKNLEIGYSESGNPVLFGSTWYNGILKYVLPSINDVNIDKSESEVGFSLSQNYPNPFNPTTKIKYSIPTLPVSSTLIKGRNEVGFVTLKVYDILGDEVSTLVNEEKPAGRYEVEFDGSKLSSGIYFYVLKAGDIRLSRKMCLIK